MALFHASLFQALDTDGDPISGAIWKFYLTGTSTPTAVFSDFDFGTSLGATVTANSAGRFVPIYLDDDVTYRAVLCNAAGTPIDPYDIDPVASDAGLSATLALSSGSSLLGYINSPTGSVATTVQTALRRSLWIEDFGAVGDGVTDNKAVFDLFRAAFATIIAATPEACVTLLMSYGKTYASRDNGPFLGLGGKLIVNANGARFLNIITAGQSAFGFDHFPMVIGGLGYVDNVTTMMAGKGYAVNFADQWLINTPTRGTSTITTTTAADAGNLAAGDWVMICSDIAFIGGSPPSMHFFQYAKVLTAVAGTGVITLDGDVVQHAYSATRDNTLKSGEFTSRAKVFKLHPSFDCDIEINNLIVEPSTNFPQYAAYAFGRDIKLNNCRMPGITGTISDSFNATNCRFDNSTAYEPVDKIVKEAEFDNCRFVGDISGDGSGGIVSFKGGGASGRVSAWRNAVFDGFSFGGNGTSGAGLTMFRTAHIRLTNCNGPGGIVATEAAIAITVDGATITSTATTIVIPRTLLANQSAEAQFVQALTVGCRVDEYSTAADTSGYRNGKFCIVTSITDVGANLVIGVNYSGGTSITNGTIFRAPCLQSYHASGNRGAGALANSANIQSATGIPNGDLGVIRGNYRTFNIAPVSGETFDLATLPANGMPKRVWARVHRAYTGVTHATLGLEFLGIQPTAAQYARIDLKTVGVREASRSVATTALGADTWAELPATYTGRYRLVINVSAGGSGAALAEATQLLPMLELLVEFEDVAHSVGVAA